MKVGFIGLGIMGSRMAANLQKAGHELVVYNRTKSRANPLLERGARWGESPADVARQAEVLFTMLANPQAVEEIAVGEGGFIDQLKPGSLWVDCSTVNPSFTRRMAQHARAAGARLMDAPVVGSRVPAEKGELVFLCGGEAADVELCQPLFQAMGRQVVHAGGTGMGSALKLCNNLILGEEMVAFSEALVLGQSLGLDRELIFNTLLGLTAAPPFMAAKRSKIETGKFDPDFSLQWMEKDLNLVAISAIEQGVSLPGASTTRELYALADRYGLASEDFSAIYRFLVEKINHRPNDAENRKEKGWLSGVD
ncbi:MAG: NAD(P)-dependent oxidoreductase [Chloroflexi bacterium]|nr:NAD(P)-dependent oxidoreductase [Chloroflexota bacterium]